MLGIAAGLFTAFLERTQIGAEGAEFDISAIERVLIAGRAFWFYLAKLIWPVDLMFIYPRWEVDAGALWQYLFPLAALVLLAVSVAASGDDRGRRWPRCCSLPAPCFRRSASSTSTRSATPSSRIIFSIWRASGY